MHLRMEFDSGIGPLVSECGFKTAMVNSYLKCKTDSKKLQFGIEKCKKIHIRKQHEEFKCQPPFVDKWKESENKNIRVYHVFNWRGIIRTLRNEILNIKGKNKENIPNYERIQTGSIKEKIEIAKISNENMKILEKVKISFGRPGDGVNPVCSNIICYDWLEINLNHNLAPVLSTCIILSWAPTTVY